MVKNPSLPKRLFALLMRSAKRGFGRIRSRTSQKNPVHRNSHAADPDSTFVDHTVILDPEAAGRLFKSLDETTDPDDDPSQAPFDDEKTVILKNDDPLGKTVFMSTRPGLRDWFKKIRVPSLLPIASVLLFALPVWTLGESMITAFALRFLYLIATLALLVAIILFRRLALCPSIAMGFESALWLGFVILSLFLFSPFDPHGLTLFGRPLDRVMHPLLFGTTLVLGIAIVSIPWPKGWLRLLFGALFLYPLIVWGIATWRGDTPEFLYLQIAVWKILPPLVLQPLHVLAFFLIPVSFVLVLWQVLVKSELAWLSKKFQAALFLVLLLPAVGVLACSAIRAYHLPLPFGMGHFALLPPTTHSFSLGRNQATPFTVTLKGNTHPFRVPPMRIMDGAARTSDDSSLAIPLAVYDAFGHSYPFLKGSQFALENGSSELRDFTVAWTGENQNPKRFYLLLALSEQSANWLPQVKLALSTLLDYTGKNDEIGIFLLGGAQKPLRFYSGKNQAEEALLSLALTEQQGFSEDLSRILSAILKKQDRDTHIALFTAQKLLNSKDIQTQLATIGQEATITTAIFQLNEEASPPPVWAAAIPEGRFRYFSTPTPADLLLQSRKWIAGIFHNYILKLPSPEIPRAVSPAPASTDKQAATLQFIYPLWGDSVSGRIPLEVDLGPTPPRDLRAIQFFANDTAIGTIQAPPYVIYWDAPAQGSPPITLRAKASFGNGVSAEDSVRVQANGASRLRFTAPNFGQFVGRDIAISLSVENGAPAAIEKVEFTLDNTTISPREDPKRPLAFHWKAAPDLKGKHLLKAVITLGDASKISAAVPIQVGTGTLAIRGATEKIAADKNAENTVLFTAPALQWILDNSQHFGENDAKKRFEAIQSAILKWASVPDLNAKWALTSIGGKRHHIRSGCADYRTSPLTSGAYFSKSLLALHPRGAMPLARGLREFFKNNKLDQATRLILILGGVDTCTESLGALFKSETAKEKILETISSSIVVPYPKAAVTQSFFQELATAIRAPLFFLEEGASVSELIEKALSYELTLSDREDTVVWTGAFRPDAIELPMGTYRYRIGNFHSPLTGEFTLKNKQTLTWRVSPKPEQNPPFTIQVQP